MSLPELTIVVPCYNGGRFFDQMFASLDRQTFRNFEVIVVDDGSTDADTKARLQNLPVGTSVIHQENKGLAAARNTGFKAARADIVLPLDCDDVLEPTFLSEAMALLAAAPPEVAFVFSDIKLIGGRLLPVWGLYKAASDRADAFRLAVSGDHPVPHLPASLGPQRVDLVLEKHDLFQQLPRLLIELHVLRDLLLELQLCLDKLIGQLR